MARTYPAGRRPGSRLKRRDSRSYFQYSRGSSYGELMISWSMDFEGIATLKQIPHFVRNDMGGLGNDMGGLGSDVSPGSVVASVAAPASIAALAWSCDLSSRIRSLVFGEGVRDLFLGLLAWVSVGQLSCEILPRWVVTLNQVDFLFAAPAFNFLFASDSFADVGEVFQMDKAEGSVAGRKARNEALAMLDHSFLEIAGDARVDGAGAAG